VILCPKLQNFLRIWQWSWFNFAFAIALHGFHPSNKQTKMSFEHGFTFSFFLFFSPLKQFFVTF
jgi:hypothetical protein